MAEQTERCSAYVVIPAPVFFDRDLPPNARLLYGLISNLCNDRGYCWAKNETLCRYLECKERTLRNLLGQLRDRGYIQVEQLEAGIPGGRRIYLAAFPQRPAEIRRVVEDEAAQDPGKNLPGGGKKMPGTPAKICPPNIMLNNKDKYTPLTPQGERAGPKEPFPPEVLEMGPELSSAVLDWLSYKEEKRQTYKPTGRRSLISQIRRRAEEHGEAAMADVIRRSMAANYQGIVWDWLPAKPATSSPAGAETIEPTDVGEWY
jgi:hypothetical protein